MEAVIDYEFLRGSQDEVIVKEVAISVNNVITPCTLTDLPKTESTGTMARLITTS